MIWNYSPRTILEAKGAFFLFNVPFISLAELAQFRYTEYRNYSKEDSMRESLTVSGRGQITLPASMRKRLGIEAGGVLIAEEREGDIVLRPAAVLEIETYSDADIARWDAEDRLDDAERTAILQRFNK